MKINGINSSFAFKRALKPEEIADYTDVMERAREKLGTDGKNILYVPDVSLPQKNLTGMGNFGDPRSIEFFDMMKIYLGIDTVLTTPQGAYYVDPVGKSYQKANIDNCNEFNPYVSSSFLLGDHVINPELLTHEEYGSLISTGEFKHTFIDKNESPDAKEVVNFKNILAPFDSSKVEKLLLEAFERITPENVLVPQLNKFAKVEGDNVVKRIIFEKLAQKNATYDWETWPDEDKYLFSDSKGKTDSLPHNKERIEELTKKYNKDIKFTLFKQFFAHKSLEEAKTKLNDRGIKLIGDVPIAFTPDEVWANQQYFDTTSFIGHPGWKTYPINFEKMYEDASGKNPYSFKMIEKRIEQKLKHYDGLRIDAAWVYIQPHLTDRAGIVKTLPTANSQFIGKDNYIGSRIIDLIEKTAKKVKGDDYDLSNIIYETEIGLGPKFSAFDSKGEAIDPLKNRLQIYTTRYKNADGTWGSYNALTNHKKLKPNEFILTATTHDNAPLENLAKGKILQGGAVIPAQVIEDQKTQLQNQFKTQEPITTPNEFKDAKQAEVSLANNQMRTFFDLFGWGFNEDIDEGSIVKKYYETRIGENFDSAYIKALEDGKGFNPMNALRQAFVSKGLDTKEPELFEEIVYYDKVLRQKSNKPTLPTKGSFFNRKA